MTKLNSIFLFGIITLLGFTSCSNNSDPRDEIITIDLLDIPKEEKELKLSEFVESVEYVKLETLSESIFGPASITIGKKYILVNQWSGPAQLLLFDRKGTFLRKIGREGKGPGEYLRINGSLFSPYEDYILINEYRRKEFIEYNINGSVRRTINYNELISDDFSSMRFLPNNNLLLFMDRSYVETRNYHLIRIYDSDYNLIKEKFPVNCESFNTSGGWFQGTSSFYLKENKIHFSEFYYDTLYVDEANNIKAKYHFLIKTNHVPGYFIPMPYNIIDYNFLGVFTDIGEFFIFSMIRSGNEDFYDLVYNKITGNFFTLTLLKTYNVENTKEAALFNDVDGFYHVRLLKTPEEYICKPLEIMDLKEYIKNESHLENEVLFPDKGLELIDLVNNSSDEDNPILQIFHLKK